MSKKDVKYTVRPSCEKEHHGITVKAAICISDTSDTEKEWKCIADHSASAKEWRCVLLHWQAKSHGYSKLALSIRLYLADLLKCKYLLVLSS